MKTVAYALNIVSNILPDGNKPFNGLGIFCSIGIVGVIVAPSNIILDANNATPGANKFIATPDIVWSALKVTVANAWTKANKPPAKPPIINANHGLPNMYPAAAPAKAPIVIIPSIPMLTIPEFSENTPPNAANIRGVEYIKVVLIIKAISCIMHYPLYFYSLWILYITFLIHCLKL